MDQNPVPDQKLVQSIGGKDQKEPGEREAEGSPGSPIRNLSADHGHPVALDEKTGQQKDNPPKID
jgi:hypothetical protein